MHFEQKNKNWLKDLEKRTKEIAKKEVAVGFPRNKNGLSAPHYESGDSIIDVAVKNNYGAGKENPRRDFMTPSGQRLKKFNNDFNKKYGKDIASGEMSVDEALKLIGEEGAAIIKEEITALKNPPNAPMTIEKKKSSNPLIDTGDMRNAATYVVRDRG